MKYNFHISLRAHADTINAVNHYDEISQSLGSRFLEELIDTFRRINEAPELYSYISSNPNDKFRDLKLKSFPHVVIYEIHGADIVITAVMNTYRKPFL